MFLSQLALECELSLKKLQGVAGDEPRPVNSEIPMLVPYYNRRPEQTQSALCQIRDEHVTHDKLSYLHMISQVSS